MARRKLFFQLYMYFVLVAVISIIASAWYVSMSFRASYFESVRKNVMIRGKALSGKFTEMGKGEDFIRQCNGISLASGMRLTVMEKNGTVIFDSYEDPERMASHASGRSEIAEALSGREGSALHYSPTLKYNMFYAAFPIRDKTGEITGVFRLAYPAARIDDELREVYHKVTLGTIFIIAALALISMLMSKKISRPIEEMKRNIRRMACGELECHVPSADETEETGELADALNTMAVQLKKRMSDIVRQKNEREAILSGMSEGVIVIDPESKVISINPAAAKLLGASPDYNAGTKTIYELVRNTALQNFVGHLLKTGEQREEEMDFHYNNETRRLHVRGKLVLDESGIPLWSLVVMNDITRIKVLEGMRAEFVANVSHEIKTPVSAIKASVETLLECEAAESREERERFLKIIGKHADRLDALVSDVLSLSRLESKDSFELAQTEESVAEIISVAADLCREKADSKQMKIAVSAAPELMIKVDRPLFEQTIVNLIDNAIKYSPEKSTVAVVAEEIEKSFRISVCDKGCGIPKEHIHRIFERFYRVDKARSRKAGGTGLGLAIVKHIIKAHGGSIEVRSSPGEGSVFTINIPR